MGNDQSLQDAGVQLDPPAPPSKDIAAQTLAQRGKRYGIFADQANISQELEDVMRATPGWKRLQNDQREALKIIQHKISRILNGDADYDDSWLDIEGYARLVRQRLQGVKQ